MSRDRDSYDIYLSEIAAYDRIEPEREIELSRIIQGATSEEERDRAVEELINSNLRLVVHCLKDFEKHLSASSVRITRMDLIAEGNIGLMKAARKFDATHFDSEEDVSSSTIRFSTYACKCIKNRMRRALKLSRFIHIPEHHFGYWSKMESLRDDYGSGVSDKVMREHLDVSEDVMGLLKQSAVSRTCLLEDLTSNDSDSGSWHDFIPNADATCPAEETGMNDLRNFLMSEMRKLPPRTRNMLSMMYFSEHRSTTLKDLSHKYGISSERCRQVCAQGIERLRRQMMSRVKLIDPVLASMDACAA